MGAYTSALQRYDPERPGAAATEVDRTRKLKGYADRLEMQAEILRRMEARFERIGAVMEQSVAVLARKSQALLKGKD